MRTMASWKLGKYREEEVEVLVEDYDELLSSRHKAWIQVRLLDVEQTLKRLSPPHREAVFLVGFVGLSLRQAGEVAGTSKDTINRRYQRGIQEIVGYLNGG